MDISKRYALSDIWPGYLTVTFANESNGCKCYLPPSIAPHNDRLIKALILLIFMFLCQAIPHHTPEAHSPKTPTLLCKKYTQCMQIRHY
jgi:hypothetical protein